jgi:hypothetical protein
LYNLGAEAVNVTDWSVQYASPAGSSWQVTTLAGTIQPGKYYLIKEAAGAGGTLELPTPDAVGTIAMGAANGKIALVNNSTALVGTCPGGVVDFVGYGTANCSETAPTPALSNTTAALRKANGAQDTDNNFNDFDIGAPQPRNSLYPFGAVGLATPSSLLPGETTLLTVTVTPGTDPPSTGITVNVISPYWWSNPQIFYDDGTHGDVTVGDNVFSFSSVVSFNSLVENAPNYCFRPEGRTITTTDHLTIASNVITPIADARTAGVGWTGTIQGNVTVVPGKFHARSFAIQDNTGGLYIFPSTTPPSMALGDVVMVQGTIAVYHGLLELTSITNVAVIGPGTPPDPLITPTGSVAPTQGKLIQIQGLVSSITGTGNKTVKINDGSGETTVFIYSLTGIVTSAISPGVEMRAIGMSGAYDGPQVNPRYQSDIFIFPPAVTATYPQDEATDVSLYRPLTATFNHMMDPTTISTDTFTLAESNETISGTVTYDGDSKTASFTPTSILSELTEYTATLTTDIKDVHNIALTSDYTWTFTTGTEDITPPTIIATDPYAGEIDVLSARVCHHIQ